MKKWIKKYFSGLSRNTVLLAISSLFSDIATEMLYPILPIFLTQILRANGSVVGLIEGIAQATQNIVQGFSGWLSDKLQKRKRIALVGYCVAALAKPLMGMSTIWPEFLGARFMDRFGTGIRSAPRDALIAASVAAKNRGKAFGLEGMGDYLGAFLGPLITIFLLTVILVDIRSIFYLAFIPGMLAFLLILLVQENATSKKSKIKLNLSIRNFPQAYWRYLFVSVLFNIGNSSNAFLILQAQSIGASLIITILIYAGFNLVAALVSYPAGTLSDRHGKRNILLASFLIFVITYLGFASTQNIIYIAALFILYGMYQGTFRAIGKALAIDLTPAHLHASGIGWYMTTMGMSQLLASVVAGMLWDHISHTAVFLFGAIFASLGSIMLIWLIPAKPSIKSA